ncbi:MAG: RNA polymerase sigma factor [Woeseiaceae bacterium]
MPVHLDDKRLAKQLLAGDARAFDRFFDENFARLYRFTMARSSSDPEATQEIVQMTLSRAVRKMHTYRAESTMFTWLCAICRHEISDWFQRQGRYEKHIVLVEDFPEVQAAVESFHAPAEDSPERQYQRVEVLRLIQVALDRLPPKYGDVLEWKYVEGHSVKDISARLNIGTEATQSLLARAKRAFADVYCTLNSALTTHDGLEQS